MERACSCRPGRGSERRGGPAIGGGITDLPGLLVLWDEHRRQYAPATFALLLCGDASDADRTVFDYAVDNWAQLSDMSAVYCSLTLIAWRLDRLDNQAPPQLGAPPARDLGYLHVAPSWALGAPGLYSLAQALGLDLADLPLVAVFREPWEFGDVLAIPLRPVLAAYESSGDALYRFFATFFTACREVADATPRRRLKTIKRAMDEDTKGVSASGPFTKLAKTGLVAEVVEGIVKGLSPS